MSLFLIGVGGGFLAFPHCLGMCGGFMLHFSREPERHKMLNRQVLWLAGKLTSYTFLGALAGYLGGRIIPFLRDGALQGIFSGITGLVIIVMGIFMLGLVPLKAGGGNGEDLLATFCRKFLARPTPGAALTFGVVAGFLPCPIVLALLAYALQAASVLDGMMVMAGVGIGTMAPLITFGTATRFAALHRHGWGGRAGGVILILVGIVTLARGTPLHHRLMGCTPPGSEVQGKVSATCCSGKSHGNSRVR